MSAATDAGNTRQLTVRLPRDVYQRAQRAARARKKSLSGLVRALLQDLERQDREAELERAYGVLGADADASVEDMFAAQREVARRG
jgi:hypothetical protein